MATPPNTLLVLKSGEMKPERTVAYRELCLPESELGRVFLERWFVPEIWGRKTKDLDFWENIGADIKLMGQNFPRSNPDWNFYDWRDRLSVFNPYHLGRESNQQSIFRDFWRKIYATLNKDVLYFSTGTIIDIREHDFLVTTPLPKAKEHVQEAEGAIRLFRETGEILHYIRDMWPFPKNLKIGSKVFYVDNRAIRGFAVVTNIDIDTVTVNMDVDTWRWIDPIPCDYSKIKPPQSYARAIGHSYLEGVEKVQVIGGWLDPMP